MKKYLILGFFMVAMSWIYGQAPTLIHSSTYTAFGAGTAGIPNINVNIPSGKNRVMVVSLFVERQHSPQNSNWHTAADGTLANVIQPSILANVDGVETQFVEGRTSYHEPSAGSGNTNFSTSYTIRSLSDMDGLPNGPTTITFPNLNLPESLGDEMVVAISVFENVKPGVHIVNSNRVTSFSANTITVGGTAPTPLTGSVPGAPVGWSASDLIYLANGTFSQQGANLTYSTGWNSLGNISISNTGGLSNSFTNEPDGLRFASIYRNGVAGNPSVTITRGSTTLIHRGAAYLYALIPFARPSVSGTVYRDNNGNTTIDAGGTGSGVWNTSNTLRVNAVRDNVVIATATVSSSGVFNFPAGGAITEGDTVTFQLSTTAGTVGSAPPPISLPPGWTTVGESTTSGPNDGTHDGQFTLTIGATNSPNNTTNRFGVNFCFAGNTAPPVNATFTNDCTSSNPTTANLVGAHTGSTPASASLVWFTTPTRAAGTQVANPAAVGAGTYYAFYFDSNSNCYSPASSAVNVTIIDCITCSSGTANIPRSGTVTVNGVQITSSYTGAVAEYGPAYTSCSSYTTSSGSLWVGGPNESSSPWQVKLVFNKPVNDLVFIITASGRPTNEDFIFNSNGGAVSISSTNNCYTTISGNMILSGAGAPTTGGGGIFKISAAANYTELIINGNGGTNGSMIAVCSASITEACLAGPTAPAVNTTVSNACPDTTYDLSNAHTGNTPSGATLQWWTTQTRAAGTQVANTTAVETGTYYAFYYDSGKDCYSPASVAVNVNINPCTTCNAGTAQVPLNGTILTNQ